MKARSVVFPHIQGPLTIFGLLPILVFLSIVVTLVVFFGCIALGVMGFAIFTSGSMIAGLVVGLVSLGISYRISRKDQHIETVFATCRRFWHSSPRRCLLAGASTLRSRGGRP